MVFQHSTRMRVARRSSRSPMSAERRGSSGRVGSSKVPVAAGRARQPEDVLLDAQVAGIGGLGVPWQERPTQGHGQRCRSSARPMAIHVSSGARAP